MGALPVMATTIVLPTIRYSPLMRACEKRPDCPSPTRAAPFSLAAFLTLASNDGGSSVVSMLKVLVGTHPSILPLEGWSP